jgi:cobalamin biosynthesis protein CobD/CbiB
MTSMTVESAKNIGIGVALVLVAVMVLMAWLVKTVTTKVISVLIFAGLAFGVWTQRTSLEDCAGKVKARAALGDTTDVTCTFLGSDIKVSAPGVP